MARTCRRFCTSGKARLLKTPGKLKHVPQRDSFAARREEACGFGDVDFRDEQSSLGVGLVAEQCPVWSHDGRSGRRPCACTVYSREETGVLSGATQGCFLME